MQVICNHAHQRNQCLSRSCWWREDMEDADSSSFIIIVVIVVVVIIIIYMYLKTPCILPVLGMTGRNSHK